MQHSAAIWTEAPYWADVYKDPNWKDEKAVWKVEEPYSHEETEKLFQVGMDFFKTKDVQEKKFSTDLVPVQFPDAKYPVLTPFFPDSASTQFLQAPVRYALYSMKGEPLDVDITVAAAPIYTLLDEGGKVILSNDKFKPLSERMVGENKVHKFQLKVPRAGLYYFDVKVAGWWGIGFPKGRMGTVELRRTNALDSYVWGNTNHYFYVPLGTREIQYYWAGAPHKLIDPADNVVVDTTASGEYITVGVPEGMDGQVWSITGRLGHLWLFNCPNYTAATPEALMVPREVAEKDGLVILQG